MFAAGVGLWNQQSCESCLPGACSCQHDPSLKLKNESNGMGKKHVKRFQGKDLLWLVRKWDRLYNIDFPSLNRDISDGQEVCLTKLKFFLLAMRITLS